MISVAVIKNKQKNNNKKPDREQLREERINMIYNPRLQSVMGVGWGGGQGTRIWKQLATPHPVMGREK